VATTVLGVGPKRQIFAELAPFTATGVDKRTSTPGADFFSLVVEFSTKWVDIIFRIFYAA